MGCAARVGSRWRRAEEWSTTLRYIDEDAMTDHAGRVTGMTYDAAGRLTSVTRSDHSFFGCG